ncbi:MAG: hypothetical protein JST75_04385 [Bacteroidetes bacterium]|nr:hypothetical protein [Bacteroidota bacterium]
MIKKENISKWFTKGKIIFASIAAIITFSITLYNQFKSAKKTEISGFVSSAKETVVPVDAIVKIISPVQSETQTDAQGKFRFKLENLQSDTFLLLIQNKKTNTEIKQNEYVDAGNGRKDILVLFNPGVNDGRIYYQLGKSNASSPLFRAPEIVNSFKKAFHIKRRH